VLAEKLTPPLFLRSDLAPPIALGFDLAHPHRQLRGP
jgi:hypothetical protein